MRSAPAPGRGTIGALLALLEGRRIAVLTGAGVSTDSGIPDYRGLGSPQRTPMTYAQFVGDERFRRHYWARNHVGWARVQRTSPNAGHRALAELEARGIVVGVVTQNVDTLHEQAGSRRVVDLHGRFDRVVCLGCGHPLPRAELAQTLTELNPTFLDRVDPVGDVETAPDADAVVEDTAHFKVAPCPACGGMLKPDIVYFGETVPPARVEAAFGIVDDADALLVVGSSLAVQSGLRLVRRAVAAEHPVAVVNRGATKGDRHAAVTVHAGASEVLQLLAAHLPPVR